MALYHIGFRIEIPNRPGLNKIVTKYNANHTAQILDLFVDGKIVAEKKNDMILARGLTIDKVTTGLTNFSFLCELKAKKNEIERIAKIVNVLGNDRLIRERVQTFVSKQSILNSIPELSPLVAAFEDLEKLIPGLIKSGWYFAPEIKL